VTVIDPGVASLFRNKVSAAISVGNGFGKLTGVTQIDELGTLETPIALTNTLAVGAGLQGLIDIVRRTTPDLGPEETINAVVGETNDGYLNAIHDDVVRREHVQQAFEARDCEFELGAVGAGTGTQAFGWKGGIGSASRLVGPPRRSWTVGALVQTNFSGSFTIINVPVGRLLNHEDFSGHVRPGVAGSCMIVIATDAPLPDRELRRLAKRGLIGLTRTGSIMASHSGDYAIAFSTSSGPTDDSVRRHLNGLFLAAAEAVEEAIYDALFTADTTMGRDHHVLAALPVPPVLDLIRRHGAAFDRI
jgi:D-aminopeptidase